MTKPHVHTRCPLCDGTTGYGYKVVQVTEHRRARWGKTAPVVSRNFNRSPPTRARCLDCGKPVKRVNAGDVEVPE